MFKRRSREKELESLLVQYKELLGKVVKENRVLKKTVEDAEHRLESLLKIFFPNLYSERKPANILEMISVLADGLNEMRSTTIKDYAEASTPSGEPVEEIDKTKIKRRVQKLSKLEKKVLGWVLKGFYTVNSLSQRFNMSRREVEKVLDRLHGKGFLDVLRVKSSSTVFPVFFPSPHGEVACEVLFSKPWSLLHYETLRELGQYLDNRELVKMAGLRLRHAGYKVVTEYENPSECTFKWSKGSHRADLVAYAYDKSGREVTVYLECDSMSNPLTQVSKMLDAHYEQHKKIYVIVSSTLAKRMMLQRITYWAWRKREETILEARIESIDKLSRLSSMTKYIIVRPSPS